MLGTGQRGQVDIQIQPFITKWMAKHLALLPQQGIKSLPQLSDVIALEGIQRSGQDGLLDKLRPTPSTSQSQIGS